MSEKKFKVLVVEDQIVNRKMLCGILSKEYIPLEASNGKEALEMISTDKEITAVLLDLVMPVMDGYEFLERIKKLNIVNLPIIVMTSSNDDETELRTLNNGAWDFIAKPYQPLILLRRLRNAIARSRMYLLERVEYIAEHDSLTGIYNRRKMFAETDRLIDKYPDEQFAFIKVDINKFRLLNSFWGEKEGDFYLVFIAMVLKNSFSNKTSVLGRMTSDIFCVFTKYDKERIEKTLDNIAKMLQFYNINFQIESAFGIYLVDDNNLSPDQMLSRAQVAAQTGKERHLSNVTYFEERMEQRIIEEQTIINQVTSALENEEFLVYLQPKVSLSDEKTKGAEALVRWMHPEQGLRSPGLFIPILERNGYIGKVDFYIWEKVCQLLSKWKKEGKTMYPISVNVSRMNIYNPNLTQILIDLVEKYDVPKEYFQLELTESACVDNVGGMNDVITKLQEAGFIILMDDFGSGYSSLNSLKDIDVNILKIDMAFLSKKANDTRSDIILSSIIKLAKELNIPVIAEGAETKGQVSFLKENGCDFVQGYYYARPMPVDEFMEFVKEN